MLQALKQYLFDRQEKSPAPQRILGRELARELTADELQEIAGGACCPTVTDGKCDCYC